MSMELNCLIPSELQVMIQDSAARFFADEYSFESRQEYLASQEKHSTTVWQTFAEMGWLAMPFAEQDGGLESTAKDICILMEEIGQALVAEPYLHTALLAGGCLAKVSPSQRRSEIIEWIIDGKQIAALAYQESDSRYDVAQVKTRATAAEERYTVSGKKVLVHDLPIADVLLVTARTSGDATDTDGISLFAVDKKSPGISISEYRRTDGGYAGDVTFDEVTVDKTDLIGQEHFAYPVLQHGLRLATLASCAEAVGIMKAVIAVTADYLQARQQFGRPLASFQVLQHRMADMYVATKRVESITAVTALALDSDDTTQLERLLSATKALVGSDGRYVAEQGVQLHGGIGVTDECIVSHYLRRMAAINAQFGNGTYHENKHRRLVSDCTGGL